MKPMLAHEYTKHSNKVKEWGSVIFQPKFDGIRATFSKAHPSILSRNEKILKVDKCIPKLTAILDSLPTGAVLDGELIIPGEDFNTISSIIRRNTNQHKRINEAVFVIFDCYIPGDYPFIHRYMKLHNLIDIPQVIDDRGSFGLGEDVVLSPIAVGRHNSIESALKVHTEKGWEGIMIRDGDSQYTPNKRSHSLLKYKTWKELPANVYGMIEGKGKNSSMMGALQCVYKDNRGLPVHFEVGTGFTDIQRMAWWHDRFALSHPSIKVKYQELSKAGVPRFPVFVSITEKLPDKF